jgi:hypothetical protein
MYITAKSVSFVYSNLYFCNIYINATLVLKLQNSTLSVEGSMISGMGNKESNVGVSYAGLGGYCNKTYPPNLQDYAYGDYFIGYNQEEGSQQMQMTFGSGCGNSYCSGNYFSL